MGDRFHPVFQPLPKCDRCYHSCSKSVDACAGHAECVCGMHQRLQGIGNSVLLSESRPITDTM